MSASVAILMSYLGFAGDTILAMSIFYDCTALGPSFPGFGELDRCTSFFEFFMQLVGNDLIVVTRAFIFVVI